MNGSKVRVDERSVLITLPALFKVIRQLHFSRMNLFPPEKKKLKMISCTYSLPLHEELKFSRPLGILKSEKKMIGRKILLNSMRQSSPWDAGARENAQRVFIYIRCRVSCNIWLIRFWQLNTRRRLGTRQVNTAIKLSHFCLTFEFFV